MNSGAASLVREREYVPTWMGSVDQLLGGGFRRGEVTLFQGDRGVGKTAFLLQAAASAPTFFLSTEPYDVLSQQARRVGALTPWCSIFGDTGNVSKVLKRASKYPLFIVDGLETAYVNTIADVGSTKMMNAVIKKLLMHAQETNTAIVISASSNTTIASYHFISEMIDLDFISDKLRRMTMVKTRQGQFGSILLRLTEKGFK